MYLGGWVGYLDDGTVVFHKHHQHIHSSDEREILDFKSLNSRILVIDKGARWESGNCLLNDSLMGLPERAFLLNQ